MRATVIYGPNDIRVEEVPDPVLRHPADAVVRVTHACICGSDLWAYQGVAARQPGQRIGHEFLGVVEAVGAEVDRRQARRHGGGAVRVVRRHLRVLPRGPAHLLPARRLLGRARLRRRPGRGRAGPVRRRHAGQAAGRARTSGTGHRSSRCPT